MEIKHVILIEIMVLLLIGSGFFIGYKYRADNDNLISVGCWKEVTKTNRSIAIMVSNRDIEEIIDTARHEICHEINFRIIDYNVTMWNDLVDKEEFARNCNPEEYLNIKHYDYLNLSSIY